MGKNCFNEIILFPLSIISGKSVENILPPKPRICWHINENSYHMTSTLTAINFLNYRIAAKMALEIGCMLGWMGGALFLVTLR